MQIVDFQMTMGCCGDPQHEYAEIALFDGGVLAVERYSDGTHKVTRYGVGAFAKCEMSEADLNAVIEADAAPADQQIYARK